MLAGAALTFLVGVCLVAVLGRVTRCPAGVAACQGGRAPAGTAGGVAWILAAWVAGLVLIAVVARFAGRLPQARPPLRHGSPRGLVRAAALLAVTLCAVHALLLAPQSPAPFCAQTIHVTDVRLGFPLNCDSLLFMQLARDPVTLLTRDEPRQSRPLYVGAGAILTRVLSPLTHALGSRPYGVADQAYLPYVLLNLALLVAALALFDRLIGEPAVAACGALAIGGLLLANDVVKAFFWSPHQQLFNILVPLLAIWLNRSLLLRPRRSVGEIAGIGLSAGVLALAYGNFVILVGCVPLALWLGARAPGGGIPWRALLTRTLAVGAGFALPNLLWIAYVRHRTGAYYNQETAIYHEFTWLPESAGRGAGDLWAFASSFTLLFLRSLWDDLWPALALLAAGAAGAALIGLRPLDLDREARATLLATAVSGTVSLVFFDLVGIYLPRLSYAIVVHVLVAAGVLAAAVLPRLAPALRLAANGGLIAVAAAMFVHEVTKAGPYS